MSTKSITPAALLVVTVIALVSGSCSRNRPGLPGPNEYVKFDVQPELLSMQEPAYPQSARAEGAEGLVMVRVLVGQDGHVKNVMFAEGFPRQPMLEESALQAAQSAVFKPATYGKRRVAMWLAVPIEYKLHS